MIINKLKELREEKKLLQKDVANYLKTTQQQYSKYELETVQLPIDKYIELTKLYNTSIDYMVGLTNEKKPYPKNSK